MLRIALTVLLIAFLGVMTATALRAREPELSEPARWLQGYLRIDTTNPPGREHLAAAYLGGILRSEGIPFHVARTPEGRANLWARLSSPRSNGRAVLLLHHMDVVTPGPGWTVPPFSGEIRDGRMWGRGALDDKSLGIAQLAAFVDLKRRRVPIERDVIYLAVADEESGGLRGTSWLLENRPEMFQGVEAVLGEGGRAQSVNGRLLWWGIEVAQKRPLWLEVSTSGRGGHASGLNPQSATHQLVQGLARVLQRPVRWRVTPPTRAYLRAIAPLHNDHWKRVLGNIDQVVKPEGPSEFLLPGMANLFVDTVQVTVLRGGERINVVPDRASAQIDARLLPDTDAQAVLRGIEEALGDGFEVEVLVTSPPAPPSPAGGRLYGALRQVLSPEAPVVPTFVPGFTDSRFFRERRIPAYGVTPFALAGDDLRGIHGTDERIPLDELDRGVERMRRIVVGYTGPAAD
ncbi:MAG TPA: M20/M25/M40 family metallo-hydrolase [Thermoanaerobaculia bacterium]|nr:M20/M25/M40 family metallo-hydrolase [Thermoanaerobaculia bacterium]